MGIALHQPTSPIPPPSAWRTYTIYPKQIYEQYKNTPVQTVFNGPFRGQLKHPSELNNNTQIIITLYVDSNGKISQTIEHKTIPKSHSKE